MNNPSPAPNVSLLKMVGYGLGECANSLVMNGFFGFAMLYYTEALKLSPSLAGIAMSVSVFWEAITEPVMGHFSDRTRSRFGRRHPWMLLGGMLMAACFYFIWAVPAPLRGHAMPLFWYLVTMNLLLRTGLTMFFIPYVALGFEMVGDYEGRSKIQAVRQVLNMAANFAGPALAWSIFFRDTAAQDGTKVLGTSVPQNFINMGAAFSLATVVFVLLVLWLTRNWIENTGAQARHNDSAKGQNFWRDMKNIVLDPNPRWVFIFIFFVCVGMVLVSALQMYVYVYFMKFEPYQKSIAHGSTMIGMAVGAAISPWLARRLDKKGAVLLGGILSVACNGILAASFLTGWVPVGTQTALWLFVVFHASYWLGNGIMLPVATAMIADVAELHRARTGVNKDGGYSAVFSLAMRLAISFSLIVAGWTLTGIGFVEDAAHTTQTAAVIWRLGAATLIAGPLMYIGSLMAISRYPLTREIIRNLTNKYAAGVEQTNESTGNKTPETRLLGNEFNA
ncbi:MAG TPA: MFS transporter [Verrucomicrobiae bacterium]|jgi:GPH family glycoside/pentoside/hexuronide:cation symporter|nr:MFS transporter [Verrucomicrobiae bacterium]